MLSWTRAIGIGMEKEDAGYIQAAWAVVGLNKPRLGWMALIKNMMQFQSNQMLDHPFANPSISL